jgi:hypothetical protein
MQLTTLLQATLLVVLLALTGAASSQDDEQTTIYVAVDCMKSTSGDYQGVETEIWQPMHQKRVDQGEISSWALYWVMYGDRSTCDYYTVTSFRGQEQLNATPDFAEVFESVHKGKDVMQAMARTSASREHVATHLWMLVDSTEIREHRYAIVNMMYADDPDRYESMERQVFKPGHQALVDGGHREGWAMYELVSPIGTSVPYNFGTVDLVNHLNPVPMAEAMLAAHPDRDLEAINEMLQLRDHVSSETWAMVTATVSPSTQ